jgi:hypothetical protein
MKKLLIIGLGFGFILNANSAPFYKVQCYDANNKVISCDEKAKVAKKKTVKRKKIAKKKTVKKETLAEKKARERAMALRELAKRNDALKSELEALRNANLLAAAKTSEEPQSALLAPEVTSSIPAPVQISSTQIAKDSDSEGSGWGLYLHNDVSKNFKQDSPLGNSFYFEPSYSPFKELVFGWEQEISWFWTNPDNLSNSGFAISDPGFYADYSNIYTSDSKKTNVQLKGTITAGLSSASRAETKLLGASVRLRTIFKFNDNKGYFRIDPIVAFNVHRYSTSAPTQAELNGDNRGNFYDDPVGDDFYERLSPNTRFGTTLTSKLKHRLTESVDLAAVLSFTNNYKYGDEVVSGGQVNVLAPARWVSGISLIAPKVFVKVTDKMNIQTWLRVRATDLSYFNMFGIDDHNDIGVFFRVAYSI